MCNPAALPSRGIIHRFQGSGFPHAKIHIQLPNGTTTFFDEKWFVKQDFQVGGKVKFKASNLYYRNELKNGYKIPDVDAEYEIVRIEPASRF